MSLNKEYANQMAWYDRGWALYHPVKSSAIRIGDFGYFNEKGYWNRMGNIKDAASVARFNLKAFDVSLLNEAPPDHTLEWGPLHAKHTNGQRINAGGQALGTSTGIPVGASFQVEYTSTTDFGAVLACLAPIRREAYYFSDPFKSWAQANIAALASSPIRNDLEQHGFFIVTQTHATKKYTLTAWNERNRSACIGFSVDVQGDAKLNAGSRWFEGRSVNGWEAGEGQGTLEDLRVVFASGVFCRFKKNFWSSEVQMQTSTRGEVKSKPNSTQKQDPTKPTSLKDADEDEQVLIRFESQWEGKLPERPPWEKENEDC
ncbi:hypothetical protein OHC33_011033 [Knufia fluminis]|uniref:Uncharacterized protein n=1 Tax=Knufia fluminis TaxID=191047 RepID=A0AAN8E8E6_9EURO|nr:hypothetical protein OHC33_011033 [Knufia fluminis]